MIKMSSKIFSFISEYFKVHPVKASIITIPSLVILIGNTQEKLGILPTSGKIPPSPEFGFYASPK